MTVKEAQRLVSTIHQRYSPSEELSKEDAYAKGFLECFEKMKPIVEAMEHLMNRDTSDFLIHAEEVLESYRRTVLGEE